MLPYTLDGGVVIPRGLGGDFIEVVINIKSRKILMSSK